MSKRGTKNKLSRCQRSRRKTFNKIMNCKLINPKLENVDPFSETLSTEEKQWIIDECRTNMMYYLSIIQRGGSFNIKPAPHTLKLIEELQHA